MKQTIVALLVASIFGSGVGVASAFFPSEEEPAKPAPAHAEGPPKPNLFDVPPVVTNLAAPSNRWIRLEASVVLDTTDLAHPETLGAELATDFLAYLHTLSLSEIEGSAGFRDLRQSLNERAVQRSNGKASEVVIRTLVVQ